MAVLRASMSPHGYELSRDVMRLNRFLGDIVHGPAVMGEWSYIFCLFGEPSATEPWGWQFFGHHLVLNCFVLGQQMVLTPAFWGAEPSYADHGPFKGIRLFQDEERAGLKLMRAFSPEQQKRAIVAHSMMGGDLPEGRRHFADNLHLGGAFQDNRVVPYEGLKGDALSAPQRRDLMDLVEKYLAVLPDGPRAARIAEVERHLPDTHFCWIGGFSEDSPFYYRVQSPVTFIEFDHHAGVFLTNPEPAKFHVHTIVRTPNGNDYGFDLLRQHYQTSPHHRQQQEQQQQARHQGHGHHHHGHGQHHHHHGDGSPSPPSRRSGRMLYLAVAARLVAGGNLAAVSRRTAPEDALIGRWTKMPSHRARSAWHAGSSPRTAGRARSRAGSAPAETEPQQRVAVYADHDHLADLEHVIVGRIDADPDEEQRAR